MIRLDDQLNAEKIGEWPMFLAMAETHALAGKKRVPLSAIAAEPLIVYAANEGEDSAALLSRQYGFEVKIAHRVASTLSVLALAAAGSVSRSCRRRLATWLSRT